MWEVSCGLVHLVLLRWVFLHLWWALKAHVTILKSDIFWEGCSQKKRLAYHDENCRHNLGMWNNINVKLLNSEEQVRICNSFIVLKPYGSFL